MRPPLTAEVLPPALLPLFPGAPRRLDLPAATVVAVMDALEARWPGMRHRLVDERPAVRRHINVFVDGEKAGLKAALRAGADVVILTAVSGG